MFRILLSAANFWGLFGKPDKSGHAHHIALDGRASLVIHTPALMGGRPIMTKLQAHMEASFATREATRRDMENAHRRAREATKLERKSREAEASRDAE